ncbi:hypothetical protein ACFOVU_28655 [Nocardiopsis sediminis]|uniref:DUF4352 domain-containing protein n=1 Tax=Nocardiopsis sediminis TaxID=1778267 RepID=A0ABV8FVK6_9ACTN
MAHHAPDRDEGSGGLFPASPQWRAVIGIVAVAVAGTVTAGLWVTGGLAPAAATGAEPGSEASNDMLTLTVHEATINPGEDGIGPTLDVRADLVSKDTRPFDVGALDRIITAELTPGGLETAQLEVVFTRYPEGYIFDIQPDMPEEVVLSWTLIEAGAEEEDGPLGELSGGLAGDPSDPLDLDALLEEPKDLSGLVAQEESATITVADAVFEEGFTDQTERWTATDETTGRFILPLDEG